MTLAILTILGEAFKGVDASTLPEPLSSGVVYIQVFTSVGIGVFLVGLGRNVTGYLVNYYTTELTESYNIGKYNTTIVFYLGFVTTAFALVPAPYNQITIAILVIVDYAYSAYKKLLVTKKKIESVPV